MFEVGDRIVIRDWDDMAADFEIDDDGDISISEYETYFIREMKRLCGAHGVIRNIDDDEYVSLSLDDEELDRFSCSYNFFPPMLRLEDEDKEISESDFDSLLGV